LRADNYSLPLLRAVTQQRIVIVLCFNYYKIDFSADKRKERKNQTNGELECTPRWWTSQCVFRKYWTQKLESLNSQCHAITKKYPEAGSIVQQVRKILNEIETLATCTPAKVGEIPEWTSIVNSAENRNFCKDLDGKPLFSEL
jgi:hypothetical protein